MSVVDKRVVPKKIVDPYTQLILLPYVHVPGIIKLTLVALFICRPTSITSVLLLSAWFGGAIAALSAANAILTLVRVAAFLRKPPYSLSSDITSFVLRKLSLLHL